MATERTVYSQVEIGGAGCVVCNTDILGSIVWFHIADFEDRADESQPIYSHSQLFVDPEPGRILQGSTSSAPREGGCRVAGSNTREHSRTTSLSDCSIVRNDHNLRGTCNLMRNWK